MTHVAENTYDLCLMTKSAMCSRSPQFVKDMIDKKLLGNKTKAGFYKTGHDPRWKKIRKVIDPKTGEYVEYGKEASRASQQPRKRPTLAEKLKAILYGDDKGAKFAWKVVAGGLIYAANRIPEISDTIVEIDNAMKWGYNFANGPIRVLGRHRSERVRREDGKRRAESS